MIGTMAIALLAWAGPADAASASFTNAGATIAGFNGLTFTVTGCTLNGLAQCGSSNVQMIATTATQASLSGVNLEFLGLGAGAGADIFSGLASGQSRDLAFTLAVSNGGTYIPFTTVINTVSGTISNSSGTTAIASNATLNSTAFNAVYTTNGTGTATGTYGPISGLTYPQNLSLDFHANNTGGNGQLTLSLNNVNVFFGPAPEPASLAVMGTALAGLAYVQRRRKARRPAPGL